MSFRADRTWLMWPALGVVLAVAVGYAFLMAYVFPNWWGAGGIIPLGLALGIGLGKFGERVQ